MVVQGTRPTPFFVGYILISLCSDIFRFHTREVHQDHTHATLAIIQWAFAMARRSRVSRSAPGLYPIRARRHRGVPRVSLKVILRHPLLSQANH